MVLLSSGSRVNSPAAEDKSSAKIVALSPAVMVESSPISALFVSTTTFTAIDAPTAVLSPPSPPQLPGSSQVTSDATAMAHARLTILFVAVDFTVTSPGAVIVTPRPTSADCVSVDTTRPSAPATPSSPPPAPAIPSADAKERKLLLSESMP